MTERSARSLGSLRNCTASTTGPLALATLVATVAAVLLTPRSPRAQEQVELRATGAEHRLTWQEHWPEFRDWEYASTGLLAIGFVALHQLPDPEPEPARWTGGVLLDEPVRTSLRLRDVEARNRAADASDVLLQVLTFYPLVVDPLLAAVVLDADPAVAWQMTLMNAQSMALTGFVTFGAKQAFDRERPVQTACRENPAYDDDCSSGSGAHYSFFSGHTSMAFTGAGLVCAHHMSLGLYGSPAADATTCGVAMTAATAVGALRIAADKHYLSDVLVGAGVGFASGYLVPTLLHYVSDGYAGAADDGDAPLWSGLRPTVGETMGVELNGSF